MHDFDAFTRLVHEAYPHLHDRVVLQEHPLQLLLGGAAPVGAERLHRTLIDALEWLRPLGTVSPSAVEWRRYRQLQLRYVEGAGPEQIARELRVSPRQARRDHTEALDEVARLLWTRIAQARATTGESAAARRADVPRGGTSRTSSTNFGDSLEREISNLTAAAVASPTRADEVIRGVVETTVRLAERNDVQVNIGKRAPTVSISVNRTLLRQLLLNILSDLMIHHSGTRIRIDAEQQGRLLELTITIARVVPPGEGRRGDDVPAEGDAEIDRDWLGVSPAVLAMSERLAQSQGGSFSRGPRPGGGVIRLTLPCVQGVTLLLVDDNPDMALLFRRYLGESDVSLVQARSSERALRLAHELRPDVVFLDVLMPAHDGWEILQALRAEPQTASIPVVICSVVPDHALAYSLGATEFLNKPITRSALREVLSRLNPQSGNAVSQDPPAPSGTVRPRATRQSG